MRMEHDDLRARKKELKRLSKNADKMKFDEFKIRVDETSKYIIFNLRDHIFKENYILYPSSLEAIKEKDIWDDMKKRCEKQKSKNNKKDISNAIPIKIALKYPPGLLYHK